MEVRQAGKACGPCCVGGGTHAVPAAAGCIDQAMLCTLCMLCMLCCAVLCLLHSPGSSSRGCSCLQNKNNTAGARCCQQGHAAIHKHFAGMCSLLQACSQLGC